jgi:phosphoglycolate phosphatase-like HAD superfamily hydrolase
MDSDLSSVEVITRRPTPKAFIFDWDDTIFTGMGYWFKLQTDIVAGILSGGRAQTERDVVAAKALVDSTKGLTDLQRFQVAVDKALSCGETPAHTADFYAGEYHKKIEEYVASKLEGWSCRPLEHMVPGSLDFIRLLKLKGFPVYVATANHTLIKFDMARKLGLGDCFDGVFGVGCNEFEVFEKAKAVQWVVDHTIEKSGDVVVIGDGEGDIKAAKECDAYAIGLARQPSKRDGLVGAGADMIIAENFCDLPIIAGAVGL